MHPASPRLDMENPMAKKTAKKAAKKRVVRRKVAKKRSASRGKKASGALRSVSVTQLQAELQRRAGSISQLQARRETLLAEVSEIEGEISLLSAAIGGSATRPTAKRGRGRPKGSKNKSSAGGAAKRTARAGGKRPRNSTSLEVALAKIHKGKTIGVTTAAKAVQNAGYKTKSANCRTIVNQSLLRSDLIKKTGRGAYTAA